MWENYATVAVKSGNPLPAVRGLKQVLEISGGQKLNTDVLVGVLDALDTWGEAPGASGRMPSGEDPGSLGGDDVLSPDGDYDGDEATAEFHSFTIPGLPLLSAVPMPADAGFDTPLSDSAAHTKAEQAAAAHERNRQNLVNAVGGVLKQAVNMSCCTPEVRAELQFLGRRGMLQCVCVQ